jgi:alkylhydroperoxidase/carboxymuconolactone decarboxylase family protein YurZ
MARPEEAKAVQAFRDAKTPKEMVYSWAAQSPGRSVDKMWESIAPYAEKAPWMVEQYAHRGLRDLMDRGVLDRKTRELVFIGMLMVMKEPQGVAAHIANAKAAGVTEKEILAVAEMACYEAGKCMVMSVLASVKDGYEYSKDVTIYQP